MLSAHCVFRHIDSNEVHLQTVAIEASRKRKRSPFEDKDQNTGISTTIARSTMTSFKRSLLELAADKTAGFSALIDAGALCTGSTNLQVADTLLSTIDSDAFKGVIFFDTSTARWVVKEFSGESHLLVDSPIPEEDCFVYFDESNCRGADRKLPENAKALLTVGLKMGKDKLVQAAARMRGFGHGQSVTIVATQDVTQQIISLSGLHDSSLIATKHVLKWVLYNTIAATKDGMPEWMFQAMYYSYTNNDSDHVRIEEKTGLMDYYMLPESKKTLKHVYEAFGALFNSIPDSNPIASVLHQIEDYAARYGDVVVLTSASEHESEKQLEKEAEKEIEREIQLPTKRAAMEGDWDYEAYFKDVSSFPEGSEQLMRVMQDCAPEDQKLDAIPWGSDIYCSGNFMHTVVVGRSAEDKRSMIDYLRAPDALIYIKGSKKVLLLSEREADAILSMYLNCKRNGDQLFKKIKFLHLSDIRSDVSFPIPEGGVEPTTVIPKMTAFLLMLFNGDTDYPEGSPVAGAMNRTLNGRDNHGQQRVVDNLTNRQAAALRLPFHRGKGRHITRSDLETACVEVL
jgi:hypothetical protein